MNKKFFSQVLVAVLMLVVTGCKDGGAFYSNLLRSDVYVQQYNETQYDFLWVMDNSVSMTARRQFVRDNLDGFLSILNSRKAIDFQMAVVTTDYMSNAGDLVTAPGGLRVVKSTVSADPDADFATIVNAIGDSGTSFWEQGLEAAYQAISQHGSEFSRPGVPLIIVFVTDEEDFSCESHCWGAEPENNPDDVVYGVARYSDYFSSYKAAQGTSTYVFPIVGISTGSCGVSSYGSRYQAVQEAVAGLGATGSICNDELRDSYEGIARIIGDRGVVFQLTQPGSANGLRVFVNDELIPSDSAHYVFDADSNSIIFTGSVPSNGSLIQVDYQQNVD